MHATKLFLTRISLTLALCCVSTIIFADDSVPLYKIIFNLPADMQWKLEKQQQDPEGSLQVYVPEASEGSHGQSLNINYGRNITTPVKESMQQVLNMDAQVACERKDSKILAQSANSITFTTLLAGCASGKSLQQIYKVFNMPDGQYSINYVAVPIVVTKETIARMYNVVKAAKIEKAN